MSQGKFSQTASHIVVAVCTYRRPQMLQACLRTLAVQTVPEGFRLSIVVIDNEPEPNSATIVARCAEQSPCFPFHYVHQPKRGIASARNAALEAALSLGANWIAFIDDDAQAAPDWLGHLMAPEYLATPVLMGANIYRYPDPMPFWVRPSEPKGEEGQECKTAYTGNVRFSADLVKAGLRFDEALGLMGGEDNEFFSRARMLGFGIKRTLRAVTIESAHPERLTYIGQIYRAYWCAASEIRRLAITRSVGGAALRKAHTIPLNLVFGAAWLLAGAVALPVSRVAFRDCALEGGKKLAKGAGRLVSLLGGKPQPYRVIHGE